jgi:hypothetical protein
LAFPSALPLLFFAACVTDDTGSVEARQHGAKHPKIELPGLRQFFQVVVRFNSFDNPAPFS